jgi:hypothetical protein
MKPKPGILQNPPLPVPHSVDAAVAAKIRHQFTSPDALQQWEEEQQLSCLLERLPDTPLPADFTDRVLQALDERPAAAPAVHWSDLLRAWITRATWTPRMAVVALILLLVLVIWIGRNQVARQQLASSVATITRPVQEVAEATQLPPVEILQDFEAIDQMRRLSELADEELLASLEPAGP